ncbi:helix-turn-helix domain-containing protein [Streptomyces sp. NPDC005209]|uniref:helix-turn-helix domain-containing protein n=1 Tax=Streptomyces sp. NPDC005209 TaxID=3156715 RepID=UPI0033BAB888
MDHDHLTLDALLEQGLAELFRLLGPEWTLTPRADRESLSGADVIVEVRPDGDSVYTQLLVELLPSVTPRMVEERLLPKLSLIRRINHLTNLMIMTPWLSRKTQELLREHGISYLDLTGNVSLRVSRPAIVVYTEGATRSPRALAREPSRTTLAGPKAGRLVRLLADVRPPYQAKELADASGLSLPYVSRLLDTLEDQLLIRREKRTITEVDWQNLLRARAAETDLLRHHSYAGMLAPNGIAAVMNGIRGLAPAGFDGIAVTGSWAAHRIAPLSAGGQLMLYVASWLDVEELADDLGLLPVEENADVLLLRERDRVVFERTAQFDGIQHVALSQVALDCLGGPGRMPAEGEAVLEYMADHHSQWRLSSIQGMRGNPQF